MTNSDFLELKSGFCVIAFVSALTAVEFILTYKNKVYQNFNR